MHFDLTQMKCETQVMGKAGGFYSVQVDGGKTLGVAGAGVWEPSWEGNLCSVVLPSTGMEVNGGGAGRSRGIHNARLIFLVP